MSSVEEEKKKRRQKRVKKVPKEQDAPVPPTPSTTKVLSTFGALGKILAPDYTPNFPPGKWQEDMIKESYEYLIFQSHLFSGFKLDYDLTPCSNLKFMSEIKAGAPGKEPTFVPSVICFANTYFLHSRWDGNLSTIIARLKWKPSYALSAQLSARVGSDYSKNFILDAGVDFNGTNFTVELQYEGAQDNMISASYNQMLSSFLSSSATLMYSLSQQSSILQYVGRFEYKNISIFGTVMLQEMLGSFPYFLPSRVTHAFAAINENEAKAERYVTEIQLSPAENMPFDTTLVGYYELRKRGTVTKASFDSNYRFCIHYEEQDQKFGQVSFSAVADYYKKEYNFGLGLTLQQ